MFRTNGAAAATILPVHPAYSSPTLPSSLVRTVTTSPDMFTNDPLKAAATLYRLSLLPSPPARLPLGKQAVEAIKGAIKKHTAEIDEYESWSVDMALD